MLGRCVCLLLILLPGLAAGQHRPVRLATVGHAPAVFTPNNGQWPGSFTLKTEIPGSSASAFFGGDAWTIVQRRPFEHDKPIQPQIDRYGHLPPAYAWRIKLVGANGQAKAIAAGTNAAPSHYFLGNRRASTQPGTEGKIAAIYPGISTRLLFANDRLRFDFAVAPGADPHKIQLAYEGAGISLKSGLLEIETPYGPVFQTVPKAYQLSGRDTVWIRAAYRLSHGRVSFELTRYDRSRELVIDPTLIFSTYSGSLVDNWGSTATYGQDGSMYSGGAVFGVGFPATVGALDTLYNGDVDMGILKYSADGHNLLWATYIGGRRSEDPVSLVANNDGKLYVLGITGSEDFPMTHRAADTTFAGGPYEDPMGYHAYQNYYFPRGSDLTVSCLSENGSSLVGSSYLGGPGTDGLLKSADSSELHKNYGDCFRGEIILDSAERPCIATHSTSISFTHATNEVGRLGTDGQAVMLRLSADLKVLQDRVAFGGSLREAAYGLAQDSAGNTFVCGGTSSNDFPASAGVYSTSYSGAVDGFMARLRNDWSGLEAASYLGTAAYDQAYLVQLDNQGKPCVVGQTAGTYPQTAGVWHQGNQGGQFIQGLTPDLTTATFSTVYGGPVPNLVITAFLVDVCNQIYVAGWGGITNQVNSFLLGGTTDSLPATRDAFKPVSDGSDFHVLVLDRQASALSYATFFGADNPFHGEHVDGGTSRFDKRSVVYQSVCGCGSTASIFPTTVGAYSQTNNSNNCNNAAFKFDFSPLQAILATADGHQVGCAPYAVTFRNLSVFATGYQWQFDSLGSSTSPDSLIQFTFDHPGHYTVVLTAFNTNGCLRKDSALLEIDVTGFGSGTFLRDTTIRLCIVPDTLALTTPLPSGAYSVRWSPGLYLSDSTVANPLAIPRGSQSYTVRITDTAGCATERRVKLVDSRLRLASNLEDADVCNSFFRTFRATGLPGGHYLWTLDGDSIIAGPAAPVVSNLPGRHLVVVRVSNDTTCPASISDSAYITIYNPRPRALYQDTIVRVCAGDTVRLQAPETGVGYQYAWVSFSQPETPIKYDSLLPQATVLAPPPGSQIALQLTQNHCVNRRQYFFAQDTITAPFSIDKRYDTCRNIYQLTYTGLNPTARYRIYHAGQDTVTRLPGDPLVFSDLRGGADFTFSAYAQRRGCRAGENFALSLPDVSHHPKAGFSWTSFYPNCNGPALVRLKTDGLASGHLSYSMDGTPLLDSSFSLMDSLPHTIWQRATVQECADSVSEVLQKPLMHLPNLLTPDGDGANDALMLPPVENNPWELRIYSRWGAPLQTWDDYRSGNFPTTEIMPAVYFYRLTGGGMETPCSGWIEIIRDR